MEMAHQTDEFCHIHRIQQAKTAYIEITKSWCGL
jgi:di/tripeptidase